MASRLLNITFVFFVAMILIVPLNSQKANATHLSDDTKWQLVFLTHNPVCSNYDFQSVSKYTEITQKYLEAYHFPNSNYDSLCTTGRLEGRHGINAGSQSPHPKTARRRKIRISLTAPKIFKEYSGLINNQSTHICTLRGLLGFKPALNPVPLEEVESR